MFREKQREDAVRAQGWGRTRWIGRDLLPSGAPDLIVRLRADLNRSFGSSARRSA